MSVTYGALFAGYGGLEMGVQSVLGGELAWYAEFDKAPSAVMAHHHPGVTNYGDVTKVDWASVPPVDVITGGSPCQDLSHAGKRAGMKAGTRSGLWASMCDAIDIIRPRLVVWENVRGALSAEATSAVEPCPLCVGDGSGTTLRALGRVLGDLAELGYDASWYGLRAADVGAAHGRFRIFVFATPADTDLAGLEGGPLGACDTWSSTAGGNTGTSHGGSVRPDVTLLPTPAVNDMGAAYTPETWDAWTERMKAEHGNGNGHGKSLAGEAQRLLPTPRTSDTNGAGAHGTGGIDLRTAVDALLPTPRATDGTKGGPNQRGSSGDLMLPSAVQSLLPTPGASDATGGAYAHAGGNPTLTGAALGYRPGDRTRHGRDVQDWREYEAAIRRQEAAFGRPAPLPTEPGAKGQLRLSPKFVEWLMNLPEGWVTDPAIGISRNDMLKALGNGVVPAQAAAATRAFLADMAKERAA